MLTAALLGLVEGLTEFIPVSSTAHLLLLGHFLGFQGSKTLEVVIQLGPILAIAYLYRDKLIEVVSTYRTKPASKRFVGSLIMRSTSRPAILPASLVAWRCASLK